MAAHSQLCSDRHIFQNRICTDNHKERHRAIREVGGGIHIGPADAKEASKVPMAAKPGAHLSKKSLQASVGTLLVAHDGMLADAGQDLVVRQVNAGLKTNAVLFPGLTNAVLVTGGG